MNRVWVLWMVLLVCGCEKSPVPAVPPPVPVAPVTPPVPKGPTLEQIAEKEAEEKIGLVSKPLSFKGDTPGVMTEKECEEKFPKADWTVVSEKVHRAKIDGVDTYADSPIERLTYVFFDGILSSVDVKMAGSTRLDVERVLTDTLGAPNEDREWRNGTTRLKIGSMIRIFDVELEKRRDAYEEAASDAARKSESEKKSKDL